MIKEGEREKKTKGNQKTVYKEVEKAWKKERGAK